MRHGSRIDPPNRFDHQHRVADLEQVADDEEYLDGLTNRNIEYLPDATQAIVATNDSPDVPFRYSINPYRGCAHGCSYCYARPTHEYLGLSGGLDFETKIIVKHDAAELFRKFLGKKSWRCEPITLSGVTDCYQPGERKFCLTRGCLEVALECRQPLSIITKNALVTRDLDLLAPMAQQNLVHVYLSVTTLSAELAREMEPRTSVPAARLRAIRMLRESGVPVGAMVAPVIPGLNDAEIPSLLEAAREAGAQVASYVMLRLPLTVEPVFREWLTRTQPLKAGLVEQRMREIRGGKLNNSTWGARMRGQGPIAEQVQQMFTVFKKKLGYLDRLPDQDCSQFQRPRAPSAQRRLFD